MNLRYRSLFASFFGGFAFMALAWLFYLEATWTSGAPTAPDPAHGLTFPLAIKGGGAHYVLCTQQSSILYLLFVAFTGILLALVLVPKENFRISGKWFWGRLSWDPDISREGKAGAVLGAAASFALIYFCSNFVIHLLASCPG
jgi:hypothetical protein